MRFHIEQRFVIIPEWLLFLEGDKQQPTPLSDRAVRLYGILWSYADRETNRAFPSRRTLASGLNCSIRTVDRVIEELAEYGAILKIARFDDAGDPTSNEYLVRTSEPGQQLSLTPVTGGGDTHDATLATPMTPGVATPVAPYQEPPDQEPPNHTGAVAVHADILCTWWAESKNMPLTRAMRKQWIPQFTELISLGMTAQFDEFEIRRFFQWAADEGCRLPVGLPYFIDGYLKSRKNRPATAATEYVQQLRKEAGLD